MRTQLPFALLAIALACSFFAAPAQAAGAPRTFLSAAGSDANNCTNVATPCRHLAAAFAATAADGEIYVLDPANYGSLTITHGVSIEGHGWASIAPVSGSAAITINAPGATDKINIIGVVLDGTAVTNTTGIQFNSGGTLTVRDSVIRNFNGVGIGFQPSSSSPTQFFVSNTLISDNGGDGIFLDPIGSVSGILNRVEIQNNGGYGLNILANSSGVTIALTVSDDVIANNANSGIRADGHISPARVMVRNSTIANNATGLEADFSGTIRVTRSTITGNGTGWVNSSGGTVTSYADNNIDDNTSINTEPPGPLVYH
jgi:hypothetical protein